MTRRAQVVAVGTALPERRLTNADLEKMVDTNDEWIVSRTGIRERRVVEPGTPLSALAAPAAEECLRKAGVSAADIDGIICATITGDHVMPATANLVQDRIGATKAWAYDIANACNGFVAALATASAFVSSGGADRILVIGGDVMSSVVDYTDRNTCILFGDGAGAVLVEAGEGDNGIRGFKLGSDGSFGKLLSIPCSGSAMRPSDEAVAAGAHFLKQEGREVFQHAVRRMSQVATQLLEKLNLKADAIDLLVPHQANRRIIEPTARRLGLPMDKVVINIANVANTTGGTIPLALASAEADGRLTTGTRVMLVAFGGGFAWGACYLTWGRG
ncbi:MAG: ketoacyl-ACP synthase III [Planctomycetota bacterium]|jgi:3-oxoacyl-[acyl-carrier-protein] synthase-3|nr:ketoacyl-ACP synthase III [Planctomycetota bacterium]